jgi:hypothetical protein
MAEQFSSLLGLTFCVYCTLWRPLSSTAIHLLMTSKLMLPTWQSLYHIQRSGVNSA